MVYYYMKSINTKIMSLFVDSNFLRPTNYFYSQYSNQTTVKTSLHGPNHPHPQPASRPGTYVNIKICYNGHVDMLPT